MEICNYNKCFGCSLCANICPTKAITMSLSQGFYRPIIDEDKCIQCGICKRECISNEGIAIREIQKNTNCYAAYSKNELVHYNASSGGICTEISKKFIESGGIVIGSWWNPVKRIVEHRLCNNIEDLNYIMKSKYVYSNISDVYQHLDDNQKYLFIGIPCQVYAIKKYFNKRKNSKLYCIDLLCRGGASPECLRNHLDSIYPKQISNITFRGGDDDCFLTVFDINGKKVYRGPQFTDPYFKCFMDHIIFQENCYECPFAGKQRVGDLTIGDFWGLAEEELPKQGGSGINMVLENTKKGTYLLDSVRDFISINKRDINEAIQGNDTLNTPTDKPETYHELWASINKGGFEYALNLNDGYYNKMVKKSRFRFFEYLIKSKIPVPVYNLLKKVKRNIRKIHN